jgi:hypothetical protein
LSRTRRADAYLNKWLLVAQIALAVVRPLILPFLVAGVAALL